ncbi:DUF4112 domain-containing protein [Halobacterium jilantaiense]|uniref:DUF4112 domain-containing protein n=1 Tax=Halobacterium jilantaiense TaxID=355548 RepID=A0A1I0QGB0_9EURY|nr:DUF4112 domain-containing protein [Halobacterium jilantaiense]SEW25998.1 protein of unknown function [Halobacterium jilantaiense]
MLESEPGGEFDLDDLPDDVNQAAVKRMQVVAWALDDAIPVPGTNYRVGIDPLLGVLPVGGDAASGAISLYLVAESARLGVSRGKLAAMLVNVLLDTGIGSIPVVGDLFDAGWKANKRNLALALEDLSVTEIRVSDD